VALLWAIERLLGGAARGRRTTIHRRPVIIYGHFEIPGDGVAHGGAGLVVKALRQAIEVLCGAGLLHHVEVGIAEFLPHDDDGECEQDRVKHPYGREFEPGNLVVCRQPFDVDITAHQCRAGHRHQTAQANDHQAR
jgi:hypothetical protein